MFGLVFRVIELFSVKPGKYIKFRTSVTLSYFKSWYIICNSKCWKHVIRSNRPTRKGGVFCVDSIFSPQRNRILACSREFNLSICYRGVWRLHLFTELWSILIRFNWRLHKKQGDCEDALFKCSYFTERGKTWKCRHFYSISEIRFAIFEAKFEGSE